MASFKCNMLVRAMSSSASQMVKPPVLIFGLEGRYASALYSAAHKKKTLEAVEKDLVNFQNSMKQDKSLKEFIINPTLKRSLKADAVKHLASKTNLNPATGNLLALMAENGRLSKLNGVINAYKTMMAAHRGEVACQVTTAKALEPAQKASLEAALKKFVKANQNIQLTTVVDPSLIGGMIVTIGDKYVDMSIASKVKRYTDAITSPA